MTIARKCNKSKSLEEVEISKDRWIINGIQRQIESLEMATEETRGTDQRTDGKEGVHL